MVVVPRALEALAATQDDLVTAEQGVRAGLTRDDVKLLIRSGRWRRVTRGVYFVAARLLAETPRSAVLRAALLRYGDNAALWGVTAAEVMGIEGVVGWPTKPWVLLPVARTVAQTPDARLRFRNSPAHEIEVVNGFRVTIPTRTLADLVALMNRPTGLSLLDSALHKNVVSHTELGDVCLLSFGRRGALRIRELVPLADGRAASPLESRVRLACIDGDVPPDDLQWPVHNAAGQLLGIGDMVWRKRRRRPLVGEADGAGPHAEIQAVFRDRWRGNDFVGAAVDTIRFVWRDADRPAYIWSTVHRALLAG